MLAKLHVNTGKLPELYALIDQPNAIVLSELETVLVESRHFNALCKLYQQRNDDAKLLETWSRLVTHDTYRTFANGPSDLQGGSGRIPTYPIHYH